MITAIVFVKADVARIPEVAEAIAGLEGVSEVYSVTGQIDLIALVRVRNHEDVAAVVADRLNKVPESRRPRRTSPSAPTPSTTSSRRSPSGSTDTRRP
jgi:DNA-binding Lrp family transcriptional regulator